MRTTKRSQYALRAMIIIAKKGGAPCSLSVIGEKERISPYYLEKIFANLEKKGLVKAKRGAKGGYFLKKTPKEISLKDVFNAVGEKVDIADCVAKKCPRDGDCGASRAWKKVDNEIEKTLSSIKLSSLLS